MPKELETLFVNNLNLDINSYTDTVAKRQKSLMDMLDDVKEAPEGDITEADQPDGQ
jgi:hypothetical protein